jgi:hypothetical protein
MNPISRGRIHGATSLGPHIPHAQGLAAFAQARIGNR